MYLETIKSKEVRSEISKFLKLNKDNQKSHKNKFIGVTRNKNKCILYYILKNSQRYSTFQRVASKKFKQLFAFENAAQFGFNHFADDELSQITMFKYEILD